MIKEESDFHDLESVVQQVEQNLELMTVRRALLWGGGQGIGSCFEGAFVTAARVHSWTLRSAGGSHRAECALW